MKHHIIDSRNMIVRNIIDRVTGEYIPHEYEYEYEYVTRTTTVHQYLPYLNQWGLTHRVDILY